MEHRENSPPYVLYHKFHISSQKLKDKVVEEIIGLFEEYTDAYLDDIREGLEEDVREILNKNFTYDV